MTARNAFPLTPDECSLIFIWAAQGWTGKKIASELGRAASTVRSYAKMNGIKLPGVKENGFANPELRAKHSHVPSGPRRSYVARIS